MKTKKEIKELLRAFYYDAKEISGKDYIQLLDSYTDIFYNLQIGEVIIHDNPVLLSSTKPEPSRTEIVKDVLCAMVSKNYDSYSGFAKRAIEQADELIKQLNEKSDNNI